MPPNHMRAKPLTSLDESPEILRLAVLLLCVSAEQYQRKAVGGCVL